MRRRSILAFFIVAFCALRRLGLPAEDGRPAVLPAATSRPILRRTAARTGRWNAASIHRGQHLEADPLVTGLTARGVGPGLRTRRESRRSISADQADADENRDMADRRAAIRPARRRASRRCTSRSSRSQITKDDLKRGQERFTIYCAVCHGPLGNGQGKIWERGYLEPTSFHTACETRWSSQNESGRSNDAPPAVIGFSARVRRLCVASLNDIPLREVPVGYFFEVITKGYAGMPSYSAQIPPADRWRIIAYIRVLQMSQRGRVEIERTKSRSDVEAGGKP